MIRKIDQTCWQYRAPKYQVIQLAVPPGSRGKLNDPWVSAAGKRALKIGRSEQAEPQIRDDWHFKCAVARGASSGTHTVKAFAMKAQT
jgi:hypothetical protein